MRRMWATGGIATLGLMAVALMDAAPARAQASGCEEIQKLLKERQTIVGSLNEAQAKKRRLTPQQACGTLGRLVNNGAAAIKFATANQDWCQIPSSFIDGMKADNAKAATIRTQACNAVKQQAEMQRRAQIQAQQNSNNPFARPDAITGGPMRIPGGAL